MYHPIAFCLVGFGRSRKKTRDRILVSANLPVNTFHLHPPFTTTINMLGLVPFLAISLPTIVGSLPTTLTPSSPHVPHTVISIPSSEPTDPILANSYFGSYGSDEFSHNIYILPSHELSSLTDDHSQRASTFRKGDGERVVWIGRAGLEEDFGRGLMDIKHVNESAYEMEAFVRDGRFDSVESSFNGRGNQVVFNQMGLGEEKTMRVIGGFRDHALVAVGRTVLPYLDMLLPRGLVSVVLPEESLPLLGNQVDKERVEFLANMFVPCGLLLTSSDRWY